MKTIAIILCLSLPVCVFAQNVDTARHDSITKIRTKETGAGISGALVVVDGVPYHGDLKSIDPKDIQEVSILKQSGATALYGDQGKNGALIITTKTGIARIYKTKLGQFSQAYHDYLASHGNDDRGFVYILDGTLLGKSAFDWGPKLYRIPIRRIKSVTFKINPSYNGFNGKATVVIITKE